MEISYFFLDPSKNMTALVETPVEISKQPEIAAAVMKAEPACEQVGFISEGRNGSDISLRMAGGEFCGNAAMSAAVLCSEACGKAELSVSVSGCRENIGVSVQKQPDNSYIGTVTMPRPIEVRRSPLPVVVLPGISHVMVERSMTREEAEKSVREWCVDLNADALGLMMLDEEKQSITPLVYVPGADTIFWEQSCASGTTAVGVYLAEKYSKAVDICFSEPGSSLRICAAPNEAPKLTGTVKILYKKAIIV